MIQITLVKMIQVPPCIFIKFATGKYATSGDWRYLIFNNLALLDSPGEYVCIDNGDGTSDFSYIPPVGEENSDVVVSQLKTLIDMNQVTDFQLDGNFFC